MKPLFEILSFIKLFYEYVDFSLKLALCSVSGLLLPCIWFASALHMCKADAREIQVRYKSDAIEDQNETL